uniref:rRNA N-glycosylase n=1 Tax=Oryza punctata TaxID=4537 RepID=A0A0E0K0K6_ORYPU
MSYCSMAARSSYDDLVGSVKTLRDLPLGEPFTSYATVVLSAYDPTYGTHAGSTWLPSSPTGPAIGTPYEAMSYCSMAARSSYDDLVGSVKTLRDLPLGEPFTSYATVVLSAYDPTVKRALATLAMVIREGQRLHSILESILTGHEARRSSDSKWGGSFTIELRECTNISSVEEALTVIGWTFR